MKYILNSFGVLLLLTICACSSVYVESPRNASVDSDVYFLDGTLFYNGSITSAKNNEAFDLIERNNVESLFINSPGGDVESAIQLSSRVRLHKIDVHIEEFCASSCANYVVPAAKRVFLSKNAILLWHGSSYQDDASESVLSGDEDYKKWRELESKFFSEVGVSPLVTVCGIDQISLTDKALNFLSIKKLAGFTYSLEDLRKFGLNNVAIKESGWSPEYEYKGMKIVKVNYCNDVSWEY
ncbi:hypothetical protein [Rheinheimera soli]|uniref:hypothetical protein n=1 Tax=Rheinheimera soli TaxID=443616 RepID=UPI001E59D43E|nr:hypothetical protein [Rheinheimera soli]